MRLDSLTGLRFLAAAVVFVNHLADAFHISDLRYRGELYQAGRVGVSFFFVLSGFVLTWVSATRDGVGPYAQRRFARVVPLHWLLWAAFAAFLAFYDRPIDRLGALLGVVLLQSWAPDPAVHFAVNPVAWSLSVEALFYVSFPLLVVGLRRAGPRLRLAALGACVVGVLGVAVVAALLPQHGTWFVYVFPPSRLFEFAAGVVLALGVQAGWRLRVPVPATLAVAALATLVLPFVPATLRPVAVTLVPFALVILAAARADLEGRPSVWRHPALVRLGEWSYAFYLVHVLVLEIGNRIVYLPSLPRPFGAAVASLALFAASVAASAVLYVGFERPIERRLRRRAAPPGRAPAPPVKAGVPA